MTAHPYAETLKNAQEAIELLGSQLEPNSGNDGTVTVDAAQFEDLVKAVEALNKMIREQYLRDYAETLLLEHAQVEFLTISEAAEEFLIGDTEITEDEMRFVADVLSQATVTMRMPLLPEGVDR